MTKRVTLASLVLLLLTSLWLVPSHGANLNDQWVGSFQTCTGNVPCMTISNAVSTGPWTGSRNLQDLFLESFTSCSGVPCMTVSGGASTIASGTSALGTSAIGSGACATVVTTAATGTLTTDVVTAGFNGDPTAVTGYVPLSSGMLTIIAYPSANNVNFKVCNNTSASITPGAITLNWRIIR